MFYTNLTNSNSFYRRMIRTGPTRDQLKFETTWKKTSLVKTKNLKQISKSHFINVVKKHTNLIFNDSLSKQALIGSMI